MSSKKRLFVNMIIVAVGALGLGVVFQLINPRPAGVFWASFATVSVLSVVAVLITGIRYFRSRQRFPSNNSEQE